MSVGATPAKSFLLVSTDIVTSTPTDEFQFTFLNFCRMEPRGWDYRGTVKGMTVEETLGPAWTSCFFEACPRYLISQAINISLSLVMHV